MFVENLEKLVCTQQALADCLGVTRQRVNQLCREGVAIRAGKSGDVLLLKTLQNYFRRKARAAGNVDYWTEKALHERAQRKLAELQLMKMQGKVFDARTVEFIMIEHLSNLRTQILGLPAKLAPILEGQDAAEIEEIFTREIEEILEQLPEYDPKMFLDEIVDDDKEDF